MIKVDNVSTEIRGSIAEVTTDLANMIRNVHRFWAKELSEEVANELLAAVGRQAVAQTEAEEHEAAELVVHNLMRGADWHFRKENRDGEEDC